MKFTPTAIDGLIRIAIEPHRDERGFFARLFCPNELAAAGLSFDAAQTSLSRNDRAGTLRGMHHQDAPHAETKLVRVTRGRIFDVVVDLRPGSASFRQWVGVELSAEVADALLVPAGCAHGFLTLEDTTDVVYDIDRFHVPGQARGFRFDDPAIGIVWPQAPRIVAPADLAWPPLA